MPTPWNVSDAARAIADKELTPLELLEDCLERIDQNEPTIQAWETVVRDQALEQAHQATAYLKDHPPKGPLFGIPFGAKDNYFTQGIPTTGSSERHRNFVPDHNADALNLLYNQGAILLGKTTTTEMALGDPPPTRNPRNPAHTPGGSSAGSAAAVAAGHVPFALATQTGGSINRPASYCGLYALKPTYGRISTRGVFPLASSLDHLGAMTRTLEDQILVLDALLDTNFQTSILQTPQTLRGTRIGIPDRFYVNPDIVVPAQLQAYNAELERLQQLGAELVPITLPPIFESIEAAHAVIMEYELAQYHAPKEEQDWNLFRPLLQKRIRNGLSHSFETYADALRTQRTFTHQLGSLFESMEILATPTTPTFADLGIEDSGSSAFNTAFSLAGFPTLVFPTGTEPTTQLPLSMQWIAAPYQEATLLIKRVAADDPVVRRRSETPPPPFPSKKRRRWIEA